MRRKIARTAGLAFLAALALGAVTASGAWAEEIEHTFSSSSTSQNGNGNITTNITGFAESEHILTIDEESISLRCEETLLEGTEIDAALDEITLKPTIDGCEFAPFGTATVQVHHCAYVFDSDTTTHGESENPHAPMDIECTEEDRITLEIPSIGITIAFGPQEGLHGVRYDNIEDPKTEREAVTLSTTVRGIAWTCTPVFLCGIQGIPASGSDGTYDGNLILTGYEDEGSDPEPTGFTTPELTHGEAVDFTMTTP